MSKNTVLSPESSEHYDVQYKMCIHTHSCAATTYMLSNHPLKLLNGCNATTGHFKLTKINNDYKINNKGSTINKKNDYIISGFKKKIETIGIF